MSGLYEHYNHPAGDSGDREYQWVVFDRLMTDEELKHLLEPIVAEEIARESGHSPMCPFYSDLKTSYAILARLRAWEKHHIPPRRKALNEKAAAKSRERFGAYLEARCLAS